MTSAIGWYGPLIDLSTAASHIGDFVQLLVFVHGSTPVEYKLSKGGEVIRTDIQVGDDTQPFFSVSLWQKQIGAVAVTGHVILLQNVKITKYGHLVEARTVQCSSLLRLVNPFASKGVDALMEECRVGKVAMEKLRKVIKWVQQAGLGSALCNFGLHSFQKRQLARNWVVAEQSASRKCFSLSEVLHLRNSCKAMFNASVGEIFLPITWRALGDTEREQMFVSRRITIVEDNSITEDFICIGCQLCGSPWDSKSGYMLNHSVSLYCTKSSNHFHVVGWIYRPFMLYVWDESEYLPLLVRNMAAELLFGNIRAEKVYSCYRRQKHFQNPDQRASCMDYIPKAAGKGAVDSCSAGEDKSLEAKGNSHCNKNINFHLIWLILLKILLQQGKNSPLKFEVAVNTGLKSENGRFEVISVAVPCFGTESVD